MQAGQTPGGMLWVAPPPHASRGKQKGPSPRSPAGLVFGSTHSTSLSSSSPAGLHRESQAQAGVEHRHTALILACLLPSPQGPVQPLRPMRRERQTRQGKSGQGLHKRSWAPPQKAPLHSGELSPRDRFGKPAALGWDKSEAAAVLLWAQLSLPSHTYADNGK